MRRRPNLGLSDEEVPDHEVCHGPQHIVEVGIHAQEENTRGESRVWIDESDCYVDEKTEREDDDFSGENDQ